MDDYVCKLTLLGRLLHENVSRTREPAKADILTFKRDSKSSPAPYNSLNRFCCVVVYVFKCRSNRMTCLMLSYFFFSTPRGPYLEISRRETVPMTSRELFTMTSCGDQDCDFADSHNYLRIIANGLEAMRVASLPTMGDRWLPYYEVIAVFTK